MICEWGWPSIAAGGVCEGVGSLPRRGRPAILIHETTRPEPAHSAASPVQPRHVAPSASEAYPAFQGAHERSVLIVYSCGGLYRSTMVIV